MCYVSGTPSKFWWDEANRSHLARHGVTLEEFEQGMTNDPIQIDEYRVKEEWRAKVIAITDAERLLEMVYTIRQGRIRAVTAYPLKRNRRGFYRGKFKE
jgi:uncharacterized DUF497 family protein